MSDLTIGRLAKESGIAAETLRYYERRGLLVADRRTASGYRLYRPEASRRLRFIRRAQAFSLDEIAELLALGDDPKRSAAAVKALTRSKIDDIEQRIRDLERMKAGLMTLERRCPGHGSTRDCPILEALNLDET